MLILGISAFYHDSAAVLVQNGKIITAIEEERFSRVKHDNSFPFKAVESCLKCNKIKISDVSIVAYYEKPLLKFERILQSYVETWPFSLKPFLKSMPEWLGEKIKVEFIIRKKLGFKGKMFYVPHHLSHASAAFFTSPYKKAAILTIDGVGDLSTTGIWVGDGKKIEDLGQIDFPNSLGLFYSTWTSFLGFKVNNDEYKVMGLAAYGRPVYKKLIKNLIKSNSDGSFELDMSYFAFRESFTMWTRKFEQVFGKPRKATDLITQKHKDLAASMQAVTEDIYFKVLEVLHKKTSTNNLCVSGGVALNSLANGKIYEKASFKKVSIFGPAGDSGAAAGSALFVYTNILKHKRPPYIKRLGLGTSYSEKHIKQALDRKKIPYTKLKDNDQVVNKTAKLLAQDKVVGWFQGKMEFGPRALGNRSILANPKQKEMKDKVNKIKRREFYRPFAGSVLQEDVNKMFEVPDKLTYFPFMNFCFLVKGDARKKIAAIVHNDGTCRIQTVNKSNGLYYNLIKEFHTITGVPCILNTSFNLSHEPIVESPEQAIDDYIKSSLDVLAIGNFIVEKRRE